MASRRVRLLPRSLSATWFAPLLRYVFFGVVFAAALYILAELPGLGGILGQNLPINSMILLLALALALLSSSLVTYVHLRKDLIRLKRDATIDDITEVLSPKATKYELEEAVERALRDGQPLSLILADVDDFKQFNDNYDYDIGDLVLREFAQTLQGNLGRKTDVLGRFRHGDEFLVIAPETRGANAMTFAERLRTAIKSQRFQLGKIRKTVSLTMSAGVTELVLERDTVETLTERLHGALLEAKKTKDTSVLA